MQLEGQVLDRHAVGRLEQHGRCSRGVRLTDQTLRDWRGVSTHVRAEPIYGKLCHEMLGRGILMSQRGIVGSLSTPMGAAEVGAFVDALDGSLTALGRFK